MESRRLSPTRASLLLRLSPGLFRDVPTRFRDMAHYRAQVVLASTSGVYADYSTNTLYFEGDSLADLPDIATAIKAFYNSLVTYASPLVAQNGHVIKFYDMGDPEPRAPVLLDNWNLTSAPAGTALPGEVAMCVSYQAAQVSGQPQARRRGRFYYGPLDVSALNTDGRPLPAFVTAMKNAAQSLLTAGTTDPTWTWVQYSRTNDGFADVANGWVDNEWDTQRRRGRDYTSRTTFTA